MSEEKCGRGPADCPMEARITNLERRVEKNEGKSSETHKEFYNRIRDLEKNAAVRAEQYDTILDKLEDLTNSVGGLAKSISDIQAEPGNTYRDLKGKAAWAVIGGVLVALVTAGLRLVGLS